jgi:uncharacterized PurR-regulated membrane protein YhhQ (DUF165 family)
MLSVIVYVGAIAAINWAFATLGPSLWLNLAVGAVFVLRDQAQRSVGHWVVAAMLVAIVLSYLLASPVVAFASAAAFAVSEFADWAVYTWTRRRWADRILLSSAVSTPLDSAVFLGLAGFFTPWGWLTMTVAKMGVAVVIWAWLRTRGREVLA